MDRLLSIDVGSTYSKGAVFERAGDRLAVVSRAVVPTTPEYLPRGFYELLEKLRLAPESLKDLQTVWSSSARGGLGIIAIGIVPELTLKMARQAACSAGGKVLSVFNYKLTGDDLKRINECAPDILLFTGGTDGGNESIVLHNAGILRDLHVDVPVIYAGNRVLRERIREIFSRHTLYVVDNVLPYMEHPDPVPAQNKIREIFLEQIVTGKGLGEIVKVTGRNPLPTPYSMLEFFRAADEMGTMKDFCVIDMGGATTDFYSMCKNSYQPGVIVKGLSEPDVKRTVEGDTGMRISAGLVAQTAAARIKPELERYNLSINDFEQYVEQITAHPDLLPETENECVFDRILAAACVRIAAERHAGQRRVIYTVAGAVEVQSGKDLSRVKTVIGTGGYLAGCDAAFMRRAFAGIVPEDAGQTYLLPEKPEFRFDREYLLPLLANAARIYPAEAAATLPEISFTEA